jgi:hypothetical protein
VRGVWRSKLLAFWWYFVWLCVAPSGTGWSLLGLLVFELVALVPTFIVVLTVGRPLPSVAIHPVWPADIGTAPVSAGETPQRGKRRLDRQSPSRRRRPLPDVLSDFFLLGQQDCFNIRRNHDAPHAVWPKLDWRCGKQFI